MSAIESLDHVELLERGLPLYFAQAEETNRRVHDAIIAAEKNTRLQETEIMERYFAHLRTLRN